MNLDLPRVGALAAVRDRSRNGRFLTMTTSNWVKPAIAVGDFTVLVAETFRVMFTRRLAWGEMLDQIWFVARVSIVPTLVLSIPYTVLIVFTLNIVLLDVGAGDLSGAGRHLGLVGEVQQRRVE